MLLTRALPWIACGALALVGCGGAEGSASALAPANDAASVDGEGDGAASPETEPPDEAAVSPIVLPAEFTTENAPLHLLASSDSIDLIRAPQGGHVVLLAAQVKNMKAMTAALKVRMRRPDTGFIVAEESRTVAMVAASEPDTMQPDIRSRSQVAHVPLCPDYDAVDIVDQELDVEIQMTALYTDPPLVGSARLRLVPRCNQPTEEERALCRCECSARYALGKCPGGGVARNPDGGT